MGLAALWNQVAETCSKQGPGHLREGEQQKSSATKGVNGPDSWPCEQEVHQTETHRCKERLGVVSASLLEDRTGIEGDDVDCAKSVRELADMA